MEMNNKLIDSEILKIKNGSKREVELLSLTFFSEQEKQISSNFVNIGRSKEKDEAVYRWRYAANKATWFETCLLQRKAIELQTKIHEIEMLEFTDVRKFIESASELKELRKQRDITRAEYYVKISTYDEMTNQNKQIESFGIDLADLQLDAGQILELVSGLPKTEKAKFWNAYLKLNEKYSVKDEATSSSAPAGMGE